ncbi:MAG: hypothetical protein LBD51_02650, partial [Bifidobacteriaceae bacterium]|nr:hypothetical protein [Bifidobacteriaceae bacterium]
AHPGLGGPGLDQVLAGALDRLGEVGFEQVGEVADVLAGVVPVDYLDGAGPQQVRQFPDPLSRLFP